MKKLPVLFCVEPAYVWWCVRLPARTHVCVKVTGLLIIYLSQC